MQDILVQLLRRLSEVEHRLDRVIRIGRVAEVQERPYRVVVNLGTEDAPMLTGPLHVLVERSGESLVDFSPLDPGEGVLVLAPGGSSSVMFVLPSLARGRIELVAPPANARYISGDVVAGGDVTSCANVALGRVLPGGVSLTDHVHAPLTSPVRPGQPVKIP